MAIVHNLLTSSNNLSGFDPVAGEVDGTTIGRSYLLWQVFQGLAAFDSNIVMISSSGATPSWLASESGTIMSAPSKNSVANNQTIKWFNLNDPGLSGSIPNVIIHEWGTTTDVSTNNNLISVTVRHLISGSNPYVPFTSGTIVNNDNTSAGSVTNCMVCIGFSGGSTTTMSTIPKIIYWKSSTSYMVMAISKVDSSNRGYLTWHDPNYTIYSSASISNGNGFRFIFFINANGAQSYVDSFSRIYETSLSVSPIYLNALSSAGIMPTIQYTISGSVAPLSSTVYFTYSNNKDGIFIVSPELEGFYLTNPTAYTESAGLISQFHSSNYYISCNELADRKSTHKLLVKLGT